MHVICINFSKFMFFWQLLMLHLINNNFHKLGVNNLFTMESLDVQMEIYVLDAWLSVCQLVIFKSHRDNNLSFFPIKFSVIDSWVSIVKCKLTWPNLTAIVCWKFVSLKEDTEFEFAIHWSNPTKMPFSLQRLNFWILFNWTYNSP